jgi:signal transduction histidine kinase
MAGEAEAQVNHAESERQQMLEQTNQRLEAEMQNLRSASEQRALLLETANRVALDILLSRTEVEALRHIAEAARVLANAQYAALGVAVADGNGLQEFVTIGMTTEQETVIGPRPRGMGILGLLLTRAEPLRINRLQDHPSFVGFPPNHPRMTSFLGVPIRRGERVLGSLYLTNKEGGGPFTEEDETAVQALGAHAAVAIYHLQMLTQQRALVRGLIQAQEEERRAVAYDLHDGLTQFVMASHAHLEAFRRAEAIGNRERAQRELDQGLRYLKDAVVESRRLINGLRSLALDDMGLAGALEQLLNEEKTRAGWQEADMLHNIAGQRFDKTLETAVYRVAQESLTNSHRHARTQRVWVALLAARGGPDQPGNLTLEVRDWGCGFVPEQVSVQEGHVGLQGMIERVRLMGGTFTLHSAPGEGTTVRAVFPLLEPREADAQGESV